MEKNNLKILLMNGYSEYFLGSETHVYTIAKELINLGHSVDIFCYLKDKMWDKMKETGAKLLKDEIKDEYDLAIINNNSCLIQAPEHAYKIFVSNGIIPAAEYPISGANKYVGVSEEVFNNLTNLGYSKSVIIRNGIDCERFKLVNKINKKLRNVLLLSNKQNPAYKEFLIIDEACRKMNLHLVVCGLKFGTSVWETEEFINQADLVISLGRGALESMACQRNVLIYDYNGCDGLIDSKNYHEIKKNNFSGRRYGKILTVDSLINEFKKYDYKQGEKNRELILKYHNIQKTVQNYLDLYNFRNINV